MLKLISKFFSLPHSERLLAIEALIELSRARFLVRFGDFSKWNKHLGTAYVIADEDNIALSSETLNEVPAKAIGKAIKRVANYTPFVANCLPQACAAQLMLKRRNIRDGHVFVGGKIKDVDKSLGLHAWIYVGNICVTGKNVEGGLSSYTPLLCYRLQN